MEASRRHEPAEGTGAARTGARGHAPVVLLLTVAGLLMAACEIEPPPLVITTASLPALHVLELYQAGLTASGGRAPYTWSVEGLPRGLTFDPSTGVIASDAEDPAVQDPSPVDLVMTVVDAGGTSASVAIRLDAVTIAAVSAGAGHTCALDTEGAAWCWGSDIYGQLGSGTGFTSGVPLMVAGGHTFSEVSAGFRHSCALDSGGSAWCWGFNQFGQLGDSSNVDRPLPVAVPGKYAAISAGTTHTCAIGLGSGGVTWCWGGGTLLGNGGNAGSSIPVPVIAVEFSAISAGRSHTCGLQVGTDLAWCWGGNNFHGQLGLDPAVTNPWMPVAVENAGAFTAIAAGEEHSCALGRQSGGVAWCWGNNSDGQLGNPSPGSSHVPAFVTGDDLFATISTGYRHTCGITHAGTARCWGRNQQGQLGDGSRDDSTAPADVIGAPTLVALTLGSLHTCGLTQAGTVWCWGSNVLGQTGTGTPLAYLPPAQVLPGPAD